MAGLQKRGRIYYAIYRAGGRERRKSLETDSYQVARARLRKIETSLARGGDGGLPTKTPLHEIVQAYCQFLQTTKTRASTRANLSYLRWTFGPLCPELKGTGRQEKPGVTRERRRAPRLEANYLEELTTGMVSEFITQIARVRGHSPKTSNRYREVLMRMINWAVSQRGVRMPDERNPVSKVERYRVPAPKIEFMSISEIEAQLDALKEHPQLQAMVAVYIYAGLRREEALWLLKEDVALDSTAGGLIRIHAKTVAGAFWEPKTKTNRGVPISAALRSFLSRYTPPESSAGWYFPSPQGMRWDPDNFSAHLRCVNEKMNLRWNNMIYRHTFGSQLAIKGESLYKIATLMGNSPEICRRHYAALSPESLVDTVEFMATPEVSDAPSNVVAFEAERVRRMEGKRT